MALGRLWAGRCFGTNTGKLFVKFKGNDDALIGTLRLNDSGVGLVVYSIAGSFDGARLILTGESQTQTEGVTFGRLEATANLSPRGHLFGEWETDIGSGGTFELFPHDQSQFIDTGETTPDQLHTARHNFGAIEIDREQVIALAENIQREFTKGRVIVTFVADSEQSLFLEDFKHLSFNVDRVDLIKLIAQEPEGGGTNKVVLVEFGPQVNWVMTQGASEAWVLGRLEKLKRDLRQFKRTYTMNPKLVGVGINQFLLVAAIVILPDLTNLRDRAVLMAGAIALMYAVYWLHRQYLPLAAIYLNKKREGLRSRVTPSVISWVIAIAAGVAQTMLTAYLTGWLAAPSVP